MNDPKRIEELEKRFDAFEDETNHNLTMLLGQAWRHNEQLRLLKTAMIERFDRLDSRVTEAHKDLAEQSQRLDRIERVQAEQGKRLDTVDGKLDQILALLQPRPGGEK